MRVKEIRQYYTDRPRAAYTYSARQYRDECKSNKTMAASSISLALIQFTVLAHLSFHSIFSDFRRRRCSLDGLLRGRLAMSEFPIVSRLYLPLIFFIPLYTLLHAFLFLTFYYSLMDNENYKSGVL